VFHLAREHRDWLDGSGYPVDPDSPLFPNAEGIASPKAAIVLSFEAIGAACGQPLVSAAGLRLFGGHTPRVTGAQLYAALGLEINKIRLLARHSGETIMRYVAEAPLRSLRTDLGLAPSGSIIAAPEASTSRATTGDFYYKESPFFGLPHRDSLILIRWAVFTPSLLQIRIRRFCPVSHPCV